MKERGGVGGLFFQRMARRWEWWRQLKERSTTHPAGLPSLRSGLGADPATSAQVQDVAFGLGDALGVGMIITPVQTQAVSVRVNRRPMRLGCGQGCRQKFMIVFGPRHHRAGRTPCLHPALKHPVRGRTGDDPGRRQRLPLAPRPQHKIDPLKHPSRFRRLAPSSTRMPVAPRRHMRLHRLPQLFAYPKISPSVFCPSLLSALSLSHRTTYLLSH